jgi:hypothetical protein
MLYVLAEDTSSARKGNAVSRMLMRCYAGAMVMMIAVMS